VKMVGFRKQVEVAFDQLTHLVFEHDTSQILNRRQVLTDEELNLSLGNTRSESKRDTGHRDVERVRL